MSSLLRTMEAVQRNSMTLRKYMMMLPLLACLAVALYFWHLNSFALYREDLSEQCIASGRLAGLVAATFAFLQLILISRARWIEGVFGHDHLTRLHAGNGFIVISLIIVHVLLITNGYALRKDISFLEVLRVFTNEWEDLPEAMTGAFLLFIVGVTSLPFIRKRMAYESWYCSHLLVYLAVLLVYGHQIESGGDFTNSATFTVYWYVIAGLVVLNLIGYRFALPLIRYRMHYFFVERVQPESGNVTSLYISGKSLPKFRRKGGQFFIFRFLSKGFWKEAHPFSLSCPAGGDSIRISVKAVGDFSSRIRDISHGSRVLIDGPYGVFTADRCVREKVLLIAGGIGITSIRSIADDLLTQGHDLTILYGARKKEDLALIGELEALERAHSSMLRLYVVLSDEKCFDGIKGHIDEALIRRLIPEPAEYEAYVCGPPAMMDSVLRALRRLNVPNSALHYERFAF